MLFRSSEEIALTKQDEDLGQTLGVYGVGPGFFITWPFFGPSNPRDTVGLVGDGFLSPIAYLNPWYAGAGVKVYDRVNDTSLAIGDYESLKGAAIDLIEILDIPVFVGRRRFRRRRLGWGGRRQRCRAGDGQDLPGRGRRPRRRQRGGRLGTVRAAGGQ